MGVNPTTLNEYVKVLHGYALESGEWSLPTSATNQAVSTMLFAVGHINISIAFIEDGDPEDALYEIARAVMKLFDVAGHLTDELADTEKHPRFSPSLERTIVGLMHPPKGIPRS